MFLLTYGQTCKAIVAILTMYVGSRDVLPPEDLHTIIRS